MFEHKSVMLHEAVDALQVKKDGIYVDCTLGGGGHSSQILSQLESGHLYCFDQDQHAIDAASERLSKISDHFTIIHSNFKNIKSELEKRGVYKVDGVLFDLGVSSPQFDEASRGFSYNLDARLDMRMNQQQKLSAYEVVNEYSYNDLVRILFKYADEKFAKSIARGIEKEREIQPIETTFQLVDVIKKAIPAKYRRKGGHPAKRTFQAIRIDMIILVMIIGLIFKYDFFDILVLSLSMLIAIIPEGLEPSFKKVTRKPILASEEELEENHRSHSAKLRVIERVKENGEEKD